MQLMVHTKINRWSRAITLKNVKVPKYFVIFYSEFDLESEQLAKDGEEILRTMVDDLGVFGHYLVEM